ncbi:MAG: hypothetical protein KA746_16730 [Pyrinomonadaceae bacterium]|nr:hypothetical protein [Pyrinomonadaceae bacterium]MBP6212384.1 hypothetical protein [Pyrinomonadaceae bacterium]
MKIKSFASILLVTAVFFSALAVSGQFTIKIPKVGQPKPTPTPLSGPKEVPLNQGGTTSTSGGGSTAQPPTAGDNPILLKTTLDIRCDTEARYWKMPNESNYTSWVPMVKFKVLYAGAAKLRLQAEYFTPDGKSWFTETLKPNTSQAVEKTTEIITDRVGPRFEGKSTIATGLFGVKITDTRDGSVLFQGKFKVGKFKYGPNIPMFKNQNDFFVDQDWNLPFGYVWLDWAKDRNAPAPTVSMWLKGENRLDDLEGRLFLNGQQILTTDEMGAVTSSQSRYPNSLENKETHRWELYNFEWYKFKYAANPQGRKMFPQARFMNESDGNYTVKVYHKGVQIREVSFTVSGGNFDDKGVASSNGFSESKFIVPVKVMGDKDKWNSVSWKTDAFYGNPVNGFMWP